MSDIMAVVNAAKDCMNNLIDIMVDVAEQSDLDLDKGAIMYEFQAIGTYMSGADNDISTEEIDLFNYLFDTSLGEQDIHELIKIVGSTHKQIVHDLQMPGWALCKAIDEQTGNNDVTGLYIDTVEMIMKVFAVVDGDSDEKEEKFIREFVNRLKVDRL